MVVDNGWTDQPTSIIAGTPSGTKPVVHPDMVYLLLFNERKLARAMPHLCRHFGGASRAACYGETRNVCYFQCPSSLKCL